MKNQLLFVTMLTCFGSFVYASDEWQIVPKDNSLSEENFIEDSVLCKLNAQDLKKWLDMGGNPNGTNAAGVTLLHWKAQQADTKSIELLINAKANIFAKSANGSTPVDFSAHEEIANIFLNKGVRMGAYHSLVARWENAFLAAQSNQKSGDKK